MKKALSIILSLVLLLSLTACGNSTTPASSQESTSAESSETSSAAEATPEPTPEPTEEPTPEPYNPLVDSIDITGEKGRLTFLGFELANEGLINEDNALVFKFEFTNFQEMPSQVQSAFWIKFYQNGVELRDSYNYYPDSGNQYDLVSARFDNVMKDGTLTYAEIVLPKDDSPITIYVTDMEKQNQDDGYQMMEVTIS